jgi:hypothetical protein
VLKPLCCPLWHESESVRHEIDALFSLGLTFSSVIVRDCVFVAIVFTTAAGFVRNGPNSYNETMEVCSFIMWFGVLVCRT